MEKHRAQNRVESLHKTHLLVVAHAHFISREVIKKIIEATECEIIIIQHLDNTRHSDATSMLAK